MHQAKAALIEKFSLYARARAIGHASLRNFIFLLVCSTGLTLALPNLVRADSLSSDNEFERAKAVIAFGQAKNPAAVPDLTARYAVETSKMVKLYILQALLDIPWDGKAAFFEAALGDDNTDVRLKAARSLGNFQWDGSNSALSAAMNDSDARVQAAAATALGGNAARAKLLQLTQSSDAAIKTQAILGLASIHAQGAEVATAVNAARSHQNPQVKAAGDWAAQALQIEVNP